MSFNKIINIKKILLIQEKTVFSLGVLLVVMMLVSCGGGQSGGKKGAFDGRDVKNARQGTITQNVAIDDLRNLAGSDGNQTVQTSGVRTINGEFMDLKPNLLFEENIRDDDDRFDRLENAVQGIRSEFDKMTPAINRLISIENDIRELHEQLSILVENDEIAVPQVEDQTVVIASGKVLSDVTLPVPSRPEPVLKSIPDAPKAVSSPKSVTSPQINIADHSGKTRVVFEMPNKESFTINFDTENQLVIVETKANISQSLLNNVIKRSKKLSAVTRDAQSSTIAFSTQGIKSASPLSYIGPSNQKNYHRYYFDLFHDN